MYIVLYYVWEYKELVVCIKYMPTYTILLVTCKISDQY